MTWSYNATLPNPPDDPGDDVAGMQVNAASIANLINVDHVPFNAINGGMHKQVSFPGNVIPILNAGSYNPPVLFTNVGPGGVSWPFFYAGTPVQSANNYTVTSPEGSTMTFGGIIIKWGSFSWGATTSQAHTYPVPFPNNFFSISIIPENSTPSIVPNNVDSFLRNGGTNGQPGFIAYRQASSGASTYFYIAIGN